MARTRESSETRQRILETADRLFYRDGFRGVGIDRIIAEAGVAKMSLYNHFPSKDDLILEVLKYREGCVLAFFESAMIRHEKRTKDRLAAFFGALKDWFESPGFRGCVFQNAAVELADPRHPATVFVRDHKMRFHDFITTLVPESLGKNAVRIGAEIDMMVEGAILVAVIQGTSAAADIARDASLRLVAEAER